MKRLAHCGLVVIAISGCEGPGRVSGPGNRSVHRDESKLRSRAEQLWQAKASENWVAAFEYFEPATRATLNRDEFVKWSQENEPFRIQKFSIANVETREETGWVGLTYTSTIRRFPGLQPHESVMWQKWRKTDGEWYPVPSDELVSYPESPALRNAGDEERLESRFVESWPHRKASDWAALYEYSEPADRAQVTLDMFIEGEGLFQFLDYRVHWVEAIEGLGRVCVTYRHRLTDKSLEKLSPKDLTIIEKWIKSDGEWYRDLIR